MSSVDAAAIEQRVTAIVVALLGERLEARTVSATESLTGVGLSSLDMVNFLLQLEEVFDITVQARAVNPTNFHSIRSVAAMVEQMLAKAA